MNQLFHTIDMMMIKPLVFVLVLGLLSCTKPKEPTLSIQELIETIQPESIRDQIQYGKDVFDDTAHYIGPEGVSQKVTGNVLTCKNCHLESGTRKYALQLTDTHGLYPQYRSREGKILTLAERINSCIKMPMQGTELAHDSKEMQALLLYIRFLGQDRPVLLKDPDERLISITFPKERASVENGRKLYAKHCASCHTETGQGQQDPNGKRYIYPPLWGEQSYRAGSSMHRNIVFARYIKANMPYGLASPDKPVLTDKEAFDIAAFVNQENINPRMSAPEDLYPHIDFKPIDTPFGPYADPFPPDQHRFGPFGPIDEFYKQGRTHVQATDGDLNAP